jgi:hypothetical protein
MAAFAGCMRKHGVPSFPDPDGAGRFPLASITALDPGTPVFQAAFKRCTPLQGATGPRLEFGS